MADKFRYFTQKGDSTVCTRRLVRYKGGSWERLTDNGIWKEDFDAQGILRGSEMWAGYREIPWDEAQKVIIDTYMYNMTALTGTQTEFARTLAAMAFKDMIDKAGKPYYYHLCFVASGVVTEDQVTVAWLHDIVEDTAITLEHLASLGFSKTVVDAVDAITKRKDEPFESYCKRVKANPTATAVKLVDLRHNMDLTRLPVVHESDNKRLEKYMKMVKCLTAQIG